MKKSRSILSLVSITCVVLASVTLAFTTAWAQSAPAAKPTVKPAELSLALMMPPSHTRWILSTDPWIKNLEGRTGGKVKIVPYFAEALAKSSEIYAATSTGIADMGEVVTYHVAGQFPLTDFFLLPGLEITSSLMASRLHWHLTTKVPEFGAQYAATKMIVTSSHGGDAVVLMSTKPIRTLEELKGKKLFIGSPVGVAIANALGCTPVQMSMQDVYMSVEKGVLDGVISSVTLLSSRKFGEIMKHVTYGPTFGGAPWIFFMNRDKWSKLPPDVQKAFDDLGGAHGADFFGKGMLKEEEDARQESVKKYGCTFYKLPPDELGRWVKRVNVVQDDWVNKMESKKLPGRKVMDEYRRFVKSAK